MDCIKRYINKGQCSVKNYHSYVRIYRVNRNIITTAQAVLHVLKGYIYNYAFANVFNLTGNTFKY